MDEKLYLYELMYEYEFRFHQILTYSRFLKCDPFLIDSYFETILENLSVIYSEVNKLPILKCQLRQSKMNKDASPFSQL